MGTSPSIGQLTAAAASLSLCPVAILTLHRFAATNGTFERFFKLLDNNKVANGRTFQAWNTGGRFPKIDWQIKAFGIFMSCFTDSLSHPATVLDGFMFAGAWGPAWYLIVMESFRNVNQGHWLSYLAIPGYLIFHHAHGLFTPLYIALAILFLPSCKLQNQTPEALYIPHQHLTAIPISFMLGFVVPMFFICLPAPRFLSHTVKDTITGWYQQWHLIISVIHYSTVQLMGTFHDYGVNKSHYPTISESKVYVLRANFVLAMALAAIPYFVVSTTSTTSWLAPTLFNPKTVRSIHPKWILLPTWPRSGMKARNIDEGVQWLIQWDYLLGSIAMLIWAALLVTSATNKQGHQVYSLGAELLNCILYFLIGGPNGVVVGLMWEREEVVFRHVLRSA